MANRSQEFRVGVVALVVTGLSTAIATLGTGVSLPLVSSGSPYTIEIKTDRAPGVGPNTPVRKDGVVIGRVISTEFLPTGGVMVRAGIDPGAPIYQTDVCRIRPSSLFGDAVINFAYAGDGAATPTQLEEGAMIDALALPDPVEALTSLQVDVGPTLESIGRAANSVEELTTRFNRALGDEFGAEQMNSLLTEATASLGQFQETMRVMSETMTQVDKLASDPRLLEAVEDVPALLADARGTVQKATATLNSFGTVVASAEANLRNLEGFTEPLGERGPELAEKLISSVESLDRTLDEASRFVGSVAASEGSLNKLLTDPKLYDNINDTILNLNVVLGRFNERLKDLRPILYDVRVVSDKLAREPGSLLRGAVRPSPIVK